VKSCLKHPEVKLNQNLKSALNARAYKMCAPPVSKAMTANVGVRL